MEAKNKKLVKLGDEDFLKDDLIKDTWRQLIVNGVIQNLSTLILKYQDNLFVFKERYEIVKIENLLYFKLVEVLTNKKSDFEELGKGNYQIEEMTLNQLTSTTLKNVHSLLSRHIIIEVEN